MRIPTFSAERSLCSQGGVSAGCYGGQRNEPSFGTENAVVPANWAPLPQGCYYTGNSACGGDQRNRCPSTERYFTWVCKTPLGTFPGRGCRRDTYCR